MAEFSNTDVGVAATAAPALVDTTDRGAQIKAASTAQTASDLGGLVGGLLDSFGAKKDAKVLGSFQQQQLTLAEAVDQGKISSDEARMRARSNLSKFIANNPGMADAGIKFQKDFINTAGIGNIVATGTDEEIRQQKMVDKAFQEGWGEDVNAYQNNLVKERQLKDVAAETAALQANVTLTAGQLKLGQDIATEKSRVALVEYSDALLPKTRTFLEDVQKDVLSGALSKTDAQLKAQAYLAEIQAVAGSASGGLNDKLVTSLTGVHTQLADTYMKLWDGSIDKTTLDNSLSNLLTRSKLGLLTSDEETLNLVVAGELLKNVPDVVLDLADAQVLKLLGRSKDLPPLTDPATVASTSAALETIMSGMNGMNNGGVPADSKDAMKVELETMYGDILKGISVNKLRVEKPSDYNALVKYLADPRTNKYVVENGLSNEAAAGAAKVIQEEYSQVVIPLLKEEWDDAMFRVKREGGGMFSGKREPMEQFAIPVFTGNTVQFQLQEGVLAGTSFGAGFAVEHLNNTVAPILNRLIRMGATLDGSSDFKKQWEGVVKPMFAPEPQEEESTNAKSTSTDESVSNPFQLEISAEGTFGGDALDTLTKERPVSQLIADEGQSNTAYVDTTGHPTGGIGHKMTEAEAKKYPLGTEIPQEVREAWFVADIATAKKDADVLLPKGVPDEVRDIITNMAFNMGRTELKKFEKMFEAIKIGDWDEAANQMVDSDWYNQVGSRSRRLVNEMRKIK